MSSSIQALSYAPAASSNGLQMLDIYFPSDPEAFSDLKTKPSVIYIHGGAWADPRVTRSSGSALLRYLSASCNVAGASLSYRLSRHALAPQQDAFHPDHVNDVVTAIEFLQQRQKQVPEINWTNYVLVGHSAGATIAFQTLLWEFHNTKIQPPRAIIGVDGIYDLPYLVQEYPMYKDFVENAFGKVTPSMEHWARASPARRVHSGHEGDIFLAHSDEDELLSWRQTIHMAGYLESVGKRPLEVVKIKGRHDEVMQSIDLMSLVRRICERISEVDESDRGNRL